MPMTLERAELKWTPFLERRFVLAFSTIWGVLILGGGLLWFRRLSGSEFVMLVGGAIGVVITAYYGAKGWDKHLESKANGNPQAPSHD